MIGVSCRPDQYPIVEEFFQLFKTPWEFYRPGTKYSAVIGTSGDLCEVDAKLLLLYGVDSDRLRTFGIISKGRLDSAVLTHGNVSFPVYRGADTFEARNTQACVVAGSEVAGVKLLRPESTLMLMGYDLFDEVGFLLEKAQPVDRAQVPTLDLHISLLRGWMLEAGLSLVEILPTPAGYRFAVCLTHDIDFIGIRQHKFDHTMWGFLYRSLVGGARDFVSGKIGMRRLLKTWRAAASLPLVFLGWAEDFWEPFRWYLQVERNLPATYFLIPFKGRAGDHVPGDHASRRATAYDVTDVRDRVPQLAKNQCELGVHGIDAWHSADRGRTELDRLAQVTEQSTAGIRMHWLLQDAGTAKRLEEAGFAYDSTSGYNETVGYRNGTTQVFRPLGVQTLLELPMHIQDGALFYPTAPAIHAFSPKRRYAH